MSDTIGCIGSRILTASGGSFDFADPQPGDIHIEDIASGLSRTSRYSGQVEFYSVAEHSIHCMTMVEDAVNVELSIAALMHDASEAYTGDMPKPLKNLLPEFQEIENNIQRVIEEKFGIDPAYHDLVKKADMVALRYEMELFFPDMPSEARRSLETYPTTKRIRIQHIPPEDGIRRFMSWFNYIDSMRH